MWGFGFYYIPVGLFMLAIVYFWFRVARDALHVSTQFKTKAFLYHRLAAVFFIMIIFGWQMFHRILSLKVKLNSFPIEMIHMFSTAVWGIYMFFAYGVTYDNIQLLKALYLKKCGGPESAELSSPVVAQRYSDADSEADAERGVFDDDRPRALSSPKSLIKTLQGDNLTPLQSPSTSSKSYSYSGMGLSSYITKKGGAMGPKTDDDDAASSGV